MRVDKGEKVAIISIGTNIEEVDVLLIREPFHGKGPEYAFSDAGVEIEQTEAQTAEEALRSIGYTQIGGEDDDIGGKR